MCRLILDPLQKKKLPMSYGCYSSHAHTGTYRHILQSANTDVLACRRSAKLPLPPPPEHAMVASPNTEHSELQAKYLHGGWRLKVRRCVI